MKLKVMAIRDSALEAYMQPFFTNTVAQAQRMFADTAQDDKSMMHKHPQDYDLYEMGTWDDATGTYEPVMDPEIFEGEPKPKPRLIQRGRDFRQ